MSYVHHIAQIKGLDDAPPAAPDKLPLHELELKRCPERLSTRSVGRPAATCRRALLLSCGNAATDLGLLTSRRAVFGCARQMQALKSTGCAGGPTPVWRTELATHDAGIGGSPG